MGPNLSSQGPVQEHVIELRKCSLIQFGDFKTKFRPHLDLLSSGKHLL